MSDSPKGSGGNVKGKTDGAIAAGKTFDVQDYPPTINFASDSHNNANLVFEGGQSRRPGGSRRTGNWKTADHSASKPTHIHGENGNPGKSHFDS